MTTLTINDTPSLVRDITIEPGKFYAIQDHGKYFIILCSDYDSNLIIVIDQDQQLNSKILVDNKSTFVSAYANYPIKPVSNITITIS